MIKTLGTIAIVMFVCHVAVAQENPLAEYLAVPGAKTTLPIAVAKEPLNSYVTPHGEDKMPGYLRRSAKYLAGEGIEN